MDSIVVELQRLATDDQHSITDLLRKALLVATKLNLTEFSNWATSELQGYENSAPVPTYRRLHAELKVDNPYHGLVPFMLPAQIAERLCAVEFRDPIGSVVDLLASPGGGGFLVPFSQEVAQKLMESMNQFARLYPTRTVARNQVATIVDVVRTTVLQWSLKLEKEGIVGEGISFSQTERELASSTMHVNIENFQGVLGDIAGSTVSQNLNMSVRKGDIQALRSTLGASGIAPQDIDELERHLSEEAEPQKAGGFGSKVSAWIGKMVSKAAAGAWEISVTEAAKLLTSTIAGYYGLPGA